jgi:ABC-type antimicrobial peptide transport system permease subunit
MRMVLFESIRDLALGAAAGLAGGAVLCALLARSLTNIATVDTITTGASIVIIFLVGVGAACLPARRVMRVQPAGVLRS